MKKSNYNIFLNDGRNSLLAFNTLTGALARMTLREYRTFLTYIQNKKEYKSKLFEDLKKGGFIVEDNFQELSRLRVQNRIIRYQTSIIGLTIAPTLFCNFSCKYCFQDKKPTYMKETVAETLIKYLANRLKDGVRELHVTWYGGEPLLPRAYNIIKRLSQKFGDLCKKHNASYSFGLVTNGSLLTKEIVTELKKNRCTWVQITLDGPPEVHNQRRPFRNGKGSFDNIINNLKKIKHLLPVRIRINVDRQNYQTCLPLLNILEKEGLKRYLSVYFAPVEAYTQICQDVNHFCFVRKEFSKIQLNLYQQALDQGFNIIPFPVSIPTACGAECLSSLLIEPDGYIQKCWNTIGMPDEAVGHLIDKELNKKLEPNLIKWLDWDVFKEKKCLRCKILPICMGSCLHKKLGPMGKSLECPTWRYNLKDMLKLYYKGWKISNENKK